LQIRIPFPDVLAATEDFDNSPLVPGIRDNGIIKLDPDTITPEGLKLLEDAFRRQELCMGEDRVRGHIMHATPAAVLACRIDLLDRFVLGI
jgi:hypothetical protein